MIYLFILLIGLAVGSFLNVVAVRYESERSIGGRSRCTACGDLIPWFANIPVISWLVLKGACRSCYSRISIRYPIVELATAFLILFAYIHMPLSLLDPNLYEAARFALVVLVLIVLILIFLYDLYHKIIPDEMVYAFMGLSFILALMRFAVDPAASAAELFDLLAGLVLFAPFALLWLVSRGRWIGFGDAKLAVGIGWFLGLADGINAVVISFWVGAAVSLSIIGFARLVVHTPGLPAWLKNLTIKSEVPFGPFLIIGTLLVFFFGWDPLHLELLL